MPARQMPLAATKEIATAAKPKRARKYGSKLEGDALKHPPPMEATLSPSPVLPIPLPTLASPPAPAPLNDPAQLTPDPAPSSPQSSEDSSSIVHSPSSPEVGEDYHHNSEVEFARLLDYYGIEWHYEPRQFPLQWRDGRAVEMFTPDFYLPEFDLYIELTTMRQALVRRKNRKLRLLRALYPEINIKLLYRRDYQRLLERFGIRPDAPTIGSDGVRDLRSADDGRQTTDDSSVGSLVHTSDEDEVEAVP